MRDIENGRVHDPRPATRQRLAEVLGLPTEPDGRGEGPPSLRIEVLGPLSVHVADRRVCIESAMQRTVLALLAVQPGQPVPRRTLVDVLWHDSPPPSAANLVQTYVARLRRRLPGLVIVGSSSGYHLDPGCAEVDLAQAARTTAEGEAAEARGDLPAAAAAYRAALSLWRGEPLADLDERVQAVPSVVALRRNRVRIALRYAAVADAVGDQAIAATEVQRVATGEPLHESLHAALMTLLAAAGQQAEALAVLDAVRARLREDLGLDPGPELRDAHQRVLRASVPPATDRPEPVRPPRQLPGRPARFVGRERELAELHRMTGTTGVDEPTVIAVCGAGGIGKTALVLRWAHENVDRFPDGQLWLDLSGYGPGGSLPPGEAVEHLLRAVGVGTSRLPADLNARAALLRSSLAGRRMLVVLDNARDSTQVRPLLPGDPALVTVVTSRDALRSLAAMDGAARLQVTPLDADSSRQLLCAGAPDDVERAVVATRIAEHCDGLPLALRIVRERLITATDAEVRRFAAELGGDDRLDALDLNDSSGEVSVRSALDWSYRTLPEQAATLLRRLPLCRSPLVDTAIAAALLDRPARATTHLLDNLGAAHLIEPAGHHHYRVHDLVATFAVERLHAEEPAAEITAARRRLALLLAHAGENTMRLMQRAIPFHHPLPADWEPHDQPTTAGITEYADIVVAAGQSLIDDDQDPLCWALLERGWHATYTTADTTRFESVLTAASDLGVHCGRVDAAVQMNRLLAVTYANNSSLDRAEQTLQRGIALATAAGLDDVAVSDTGNLARIWFLRGELDKARSAMHWVAAQSRSRGRARRPHLSNLIELECQYGDLAAAEELCRTAERYAAGADDADEVRELTIALARVDMVAGRLSAAHERLTAAYADEPAVTNGDLWARMVVLFARVCRLLGDLPRAEALVEEAMTVTRELGWPGSQAEALNALAELRVAQNRPADALPVLGGALERSRKSALPYLECSSLLLLAQAHQALADPRHATTAARAAAEIAQRCQFQLLATEAARLGTEGPKGKTTAHQRPLHARST